jgi:hypothetical protein
MEAGMGYVALALVGLFIGFIFGHSSGSASGEEKANSKWRKQEGERLDALRDKVASEFKISAACIYSPWMLSRLKSIDREQWRQIYDFAEPRNLDYMYDDPKSPSAIGADYEDSAGYYLEKCGFTVYYIGQKYGKKDLGRDLLARHKVTEQELIVQCKSRRWKGQIAPQDLFYLFATTVFYAMKKLKIELGNYPLSKGQHEDALAIMRQANVTPVFVTDGTIIPMDQYLAAAMNMKLVASPFDLSRHYSQETSMDEEQ